MADKLVLGHDRDTLIVWTPSVGSDPARAEASLLSRIRAIQANYPDAKTRLLVPFRGGFSRDFLQALVECRIARLAPIQFFDTAFKHEDAPRAATSAIAEVRALGAEQKRVPQPYKVEVASSEPTHDDLLATLAEALPKAKGSTLRIVVGRAGIGKSFLFRSLFVRLYNEFIAAKTQQETGRRPIPFLPEHMKGIYALRTEALIDNFLRTDVASPVGRETLEWLLVNGYATWLLDGLDEIYAGDPAFFDYLLDLLTRKDSKAQITLWCRDSLLTTSDAFAEFRELCCGSAVLEIYRLLEWQRPSKRHYAWLQLERCAPRTEEKDTAPVAEFMRKLDESPTLRTLSGLPFYCHVLLQHFGEGRLDDFQDDVQMLNCVVDRMITREVNKGLLDRSLFVPNGLEEWLEQIAVNYVEGQRYAEIARDEALEFGELVLRDGLKAEERNHILISLLQFPLFRAGAETGRIAFTHDLIAEALAARGYLRVLSKNPSYLVPRLVRIDLEDPTLLRFMASSLTTEAETGVIGAIQRGEVQGRGIAVMLTLLLLSRPERDLLKRIKVNFDFADLAGVQFRRRDLSGLSFRQADLSHTVFEDCDLTKTQFEGAYMDRTHFDGDNQLEDAQFGDLSRVQSIWRGKKHMDDLAEIRKWLARATGHPELPGEPCPTALQLAHLFGKFITPLGQPRRDDLKRQGLVAGRRYANASSPDACLDEAIHSGYVTGPDFRDRFRRAQGDRYAEMVRFVRDGSVSDGLGQLIAGLCRRRGCIHQIRVPVQDSGRR
ncbi:MAG: pentapeptide repeat-containing protein [bacterium]|nr:pentapeptide repeat-containing protein [bacterium]